MILIILFGHLNDINLENGNIALLNHHISKSTLLQFGNSIFDYDCTHKRLLIPGLILCNQTSFIKK